MVVSNADGSVTSTPPATLTVVLTDTTAPVLRYALAGADLATIDLTFDEGLDKTSAETASHYTVELVGGGQLAVLSATNPTPTTVTLTTDPRVADASYQITVEGVTDDSCLQNALAATTQPVLLPVSLFGYSDTWKYKQDQNLDGIPWTERAFDDDAWPSGPGLLAEESNAQIVPLIGTTLEPPATPVDGVAGHAYYFRRHFNWPNTVASAPLIQFTCRIDDCAAFYLNGTLVHDLRLPTRPILFATLGGGAIGSGTEALLDEVFLIDNTYLLEGDNVVAVEVHQSSTTSSDIVFGLALAAYSGEQPAQGPEVDVATQPNGDIQVSWTAGAEWQLYEAPSPEGPWSLSASQTSPATIPKATVESTGKQFFKLLKQP